MNRLAILNAADTGATESTAHMLESVGYSVARPGPELLHQIRWEARCQGAFSVEELVEKWGYSPARVPALASPEDVADAALFVDVKGHVNYGGIVARWPNLAGKALWLCLNGGDPLKRTDGLPWADPPCPVLTHNQWYDTVPRAYVCYPPYRRMGERRREGIDGPPLCLVHNVARWGYGRLVEPLKALGVKFYGGGDGNDELTPHDRAMERLHSARCLVHVKEGDTVGYAVVEAMAAGVPVVCARRYVEETRLQALLEPGVTCLTWDDGGDEVGALAAILERLRDPVANQSVGAAGRARLDRLQWDEAIPADRNGFAGFMCRNFGPIT
jgi:hypothetical protein